MTDNKKDTGDYYRNIISELEKNLTTLENDKKKYSRFPRFIKGISFNIWKRKRQINGYKKTLARYIKDGYALWVIKQQN